MSRLYKKDSEDGDSVLICGPKGVGKSTALIYVINKLNKKENAVWISLTSEMMKKRLYNRGCLEVCSIKVLTKRYINAMF